ncbi:unnamed protein product, partial [Didymodactylos carnosus]
VMIWSIDMGLASVSDNKKVLTSVGSVHYVAIEVIYNQIDKTKFTFQINGNADARSDYRIFTLSKIEQTGSSSSASRVKRGSGRKQCSTGTTAMYHVGNLVLGTVLQEVYSRLVHNNANHETRSITPNDINNPIEESIVRPIRGGLFNQVRTERVEFVHARIRPQHYRPNNRVNFGGGNTSTEYMRQHMNALPGDERGHIVASVFSGPPQLYNMFPQHNSMNRNYHASHLLVDWRETENRMQRHLANGGGDIVWNVGFSYDNLQTARPTSVTYSATFYDRNGNIVDRIEGTLRNCVGNQVLPSGRTCGL